jgi:F420-dependent oxidoreductase-like protein
MRIGVLVDLHARIEDVCTEVARHRDRGFVSAWASQIFGYDSLGLLSVVGASVEDVALGTAAVPVHSRIPQVMAQQALTAQAASGGRFTLGIGLSHQVVVEGLFGRSFERPARYMFEYVSALLPLLAGEPVNFEGELLTARSIGPLEVPGSTPPPVVVAALGPVMLRLAGRMTDGTVTWMTGIKTVAEHIVPIICAAAEAEGRPAPRVVVSLPVTVTADPDRARARIDEALAIYPTLPSYRAMLDREGAGAPSDVAFVGDEHAVQRAVERLEEAGATEFVASIIGDMDERERTAALLGSLSRPSAAHN